MATTLNFEEQGGGWQAKFISEGACVVEMERSEQGTVAISANIQGMRPIPVPIVNLANPYDSSAMFIIDIPKGLEITIKSTSKVTKAMMQVEA